MLNRLDPVGGSYGEQYLVHGSGLGICMAQSTLTSEGSNLYLGLFGNVLHFTVTFSSTLECTSYWHILDQRLLHGAFSNVTTTESNTSQSLKMHDKMKVLIQCHQTYYLTISSFLRGNITLMHESSKDGAKMCKLQTAVSA